MTARICNERGKHICTLSNVNLNHVEGNLYRIRGFAKGTFMTTEQFTGVTLDILDCRGNRIMKLTGGMARHVSRDSNANISFIEIDAMIE